MVRWICGGDALANERLGQIKLLRRAVSPRSIGVVRSLEVGGQIVISPRNSLGVNAEPGGDSEDGCAGGFPERCGG